MNKHFTLAADKLAGDVHGAVLEASSRLVPADDQADKTPGLQHRQRAEAEAETGWREPAVTRWNDGRLPCALSRQAEADLKLADGTQGAVPWWRQGLFSVYRCCAWGRSTAGRLPSRTCHILCTAASSSPSRMPLYIGVGFFSATRSCILISFPMPCKSILIKICAVIHSADRC